jgi:hypothetical protein
MTLVVSCLARGLADLCFHCEIFSELPMCGLRSSIVALAVLITARSLAAAEKVDFQREIQPLLADRCFACHGRDAEHREGGLRLDEFAAAAKGGDSGETAIVPFEPEKSELVRRIFSSDALEQMPPPQSKKSLTAAEKDLLKRWIADGAEYKAHWAFSPAVRPAVPAVKNATWPKNEIDRFVLARLEQEGLGPSPRADEATLVRRLALDLTGLPPSVFDGETERQRDGGNYDAAIRPLLNSPHYGERWARIWLDGARYADSDGYEKDKPRFVWAYRDWVIRALNRDLPYNQFVIEQIAGDLLPGSTQDQLVATGFLRNSMINEEGGVDPEQFRMEAMFDRMDAIGKSVLGLTIQCCQCHNHKYDPISQEEYYKLFAFLNDTHEANVAVYPPDQLKERADILRQIATIETELKHQMPDWREKMASWEDSAANDQPQWSVVRTDSDISGGQKHYNLSDGSVLAQGYAPTKHTTEFTATTNVENVTAIQLELLTDPSLPLGGPGRSIYGTCALTEFRVEAAPLDDPAKFKEVKIVGATADVNPTEKELSAIFDDKKNKRRVTGPIEYAIDRKDETAWSIDIGPGRSNVPRKAVFVLDSPIRFESGAKLKFKLNQSHGGWNSDDNQNNNLGRFRFSVGTVPDAKADRLPAFLREALSMPRELRSSAQSDQVFSYWRTTVPQWKEANERIEELWKAHPHGTSQLAMQPRDAYRETFMLSRGDFLKPTKPVRAGVPAVLHPLKAENPTRLDFAKWLVDPRSPTTARSIVNRVWQAYFGTGLVNTSEDFGLQGEPPSHPELLDWLAVELIDHGWSLKWLHELIVSSATYQQSSVVTPQLLARDPANRLLARGARLRVDAEMIRDIALAASGLLNGKLGGPPVYPPAPEFLFVPPASYGPKVWKEEQGGERYRRAIYTFRFRSVPYPLLTTFDAPNGEFACVRRVRSNTPLQALATLNEPLFIECARALALQTLQQAGDSKISRIDSAFRRCTGRPPDSEESATLFVLLGQQLARFSQNPALANELVAGVELNGNALENITTSEFAAWVAVCRVVLNLDETITKQ